MRIGFGRSSITPPVGTWLVGYLDRETVSTAVPEDLYATAVAISGSDATLVVVSCDLLAVHPTLVNAVRERVREKLDDASITVWVCATHTHSGPPSHLTASVNPAEREYIAALPDDITRAVRGAVDNLRPGSLGFGRASTAVGVNRRRLVDGQAVMLPAEDRPIDDRLSIVSCEQESGGARGMIAVLGCHPVTVGRTNLFASADYPGRFRALVESQMCDVSAFLIGSAGDVNPRCEPREDLVGADLVAQELLGASRVASEEAGEIHATRVGLASSTIHLPVTPSTSSGACAQTSMAEHLGPLGDLDAQAVDGVLDRRHPWSHPDGPDYRRLETVTAEIAVARLGQLAIVALPVEVFTEIGARIEALSPAQHTLVIGLANGSAGYLAPAYEHAFGGYEICGSPNFYRTRAALDPGAADLVTNEATRLLESIWSEEVRTS